MSLFARKHWFKVVTVILLLGIGGAIAYQSYAPASDATSYDREMLATDFQLENMDGSQVHLQDGDNKVRLVYFFFASCPDVCPLTTLFLSKVQDVLVNEGAFGKSTAFYSISFDPERDTKEVLQAYSQKFHVNPSGWYFLRGGETVIKDLMSKYDLGLQKLEGGDFVHTNQIVLVDKKGFIRHYYNPDDLQVTPEQIANDMLQLTKETK